MNSAIVALVICILSPYALAKGEVGNGGDICENRIKIVRDDITLWISKNGSADLTLPKNVNLADYNKAMIDEMLGAGISCVDDKIWVGNAEKTCKNYLDVNHKPQILCNAKRFMNETGEADQYVLVHHEYAGLAGFEVNHNEDSNYFISNQITGYLEDQIIKKLVVRPGTELKPDRSAAAREVKCDILTYFCPGTVQLLPRISLEAGYGLVIVNLTTSTKSSDGESSSVQMGWPLTAYESVLSKYCGPDRGEGAPMNGLTCTIVGNDLVKIVNKSGHLIGR